MKLFIDHKDGKVPVLATADDIPVILNLAADLQKDTIYIPLSRIDWGNDHIATRIRTVFRHKNVTHLADLFLIRQMRQRYVIDDRSPELRRNERPDCVVRNSEPTSLRSFGKACYERVQEVIWRLYRIDITNALPLNTDWDRCT